ncbi:MAG: hypothetical protein M0C28_24880 [Candidatus Moduliflexus flocculans]|nr:hypothetical protein [Candidatus Moduliflexus flocculans]
MRRSNGPARSGALVAPDRPGTGLVPGFPPGVPPSAGRPTVRRWSAAWAMACSGTR